MSQLSLGLPSTLHVQSQRGTRLSRLQTRTDNAQRMGITSRKPGTVCGTARRSHFSRAFISVTVQLWTQVFWVISLYFKIRKTLPKSGTFLLGYSVQLKNFNFMGFHLYSLTVFINITRVQMFYLQLVVLKFYDVSNMNVFPKFLVDQQPWNIKIINSSKYSVQCV